MDILNRFAQRYAAVVGRVLLALIFIVSGYGKIAGFAHTAGLMASKGLPAADLLLVATIVIELGGGAMILLGWKALWAALVIFLWLIPVTLLFHDFWAVDSAHM